MDRTEEGTGTGSSAMVEVRAAVLTGVLRRDDLRRLGCTHALLGVRQVDLGRAESATAARETVDGEPTLALGLDDRRTSAAHARLRYTRKAWVIADRSSTNGTWVNGERLAADGQRTLADGDVIEVGRTFFVLRLDQPVEPGRQPLDMDSEAATVRPGWCTYHRPLRSEYQRAEQLAPDRRALLLDGAPGVGKERLAEGLHLASGRTGDFVPCNCATLTGDLVESTLFGHVAGAFTGAVGARAGLFRAADQGTLFLDEVGALAPAIQAKLLRVLETGVIRRVGQDRGAAVDVRVLAATNHPLAPPAFRADLFMRLAQSTLHLPTLATRIEDLGLIAAEFLGDRPLALSAPAARALLAHDWPGNIREWVNLLGELVLVAEWQGRRIELGDLPAGIERPLSDAPKDDAVRIDDALRRHEGNVKAAATWLGVSRQQLYVQIERYGIDVNRWR